MCPARGRGNGGTVVRVLILTLGPIGLVGASYWLSLAASSSGKASSLPPASPLAEQRIDGQPDQDRLELACHERAAAVRTRLVATCRVLVRSPFVIGGDLPESELERIYREVVIPTARALSIDYFDRPPNEPVVLLMFSSEPVYRKHAARLDARDTAAYYGYYWRPERRIMLNLATGYGTLAHELTHALAHFDFPEMPEWFDEGLAALHEESDFSQDGLHLQGRPNWRGHFVAQSIRSGSLQPLGELLQSGGLRPEHEAIDYAHARYFCLFLQQRGLLRAFYRKLRTASERDASGAETLLALLNADSLADVDRDFRAWVAAIAP